MQFGVTSSKICFAVGPDDRGSVMRSEDRNRGENRSELDIREPRDSLRLLKIPSTSAVNQPNGNYLPRDGTFPSYPRSSTELYSVTRHLVFPRRNLWLLRGSVSRSLIERRLCRFHSSTRVPLPFLDVQLFCVCLFADHQISEYSDSARRRGLKKLG